MCCQKLQDLSQNSRPVLWRSWVEVPSRGNATVRVFFFPGSGQPSPTFVGIFHKKLVRGVWHCNSAWQLKDNLNSMRLYFFNPKTVVMIGVRKHLGGEAPLLLITTVVLQKAPSGLFGHKGTMLGGVETWGGGLSRGPAACLESSVSSERSWSISLISE